MSLRGHIVEKYEVEYGNVIWGFNNDMFKFSDELDKLGVLHNVVDEANLIEIEIDSLMKVDCLEILNDDLRESMESLQKTAKTAEYAKNGNWVRVEWF